MVPNVPDIEFVPLSPGSREGLGVTAALKRLALFFAFFAILLTTTSAGAEHSPAHEAALVVRHGDGAMTYAIVAFPENEISGMELLRRSGISLVTVSFGGLGEAVCTLEGEGCGVGDCRKRMCQTGDPNSPFWQYFRQASPGQWVAVPLGVSSSKVHDGDVDGWSWTGKNPGLPSLTVADIRVKMGIEAAALVLPDDGGSAAVILEFDASGKRVMESTASPVNGGEIVAGVAALVVLAGAGGLIVRRNRRLRRAA